MAVSWNFRALQKHLFVWSITNRTCSNLGILKCTKCTMCRMPLNLPNWFIVAVLLGMCAWLARSTAHHSTAQKMNAVTRKTKVSGLIKSKLIADAKCYNMLRNQCRNWSTFLHGNEKLQARKMKSATIEQHSNSNNNTVEQKKRRKRTWNQRQKMHKFRTLKSGSKFDCRALFVTIHNGTSQKSERKCQPERRIAIAYFMSCKMWWNWDVHRACSTFALEQF